MGSGAQVDVVVAAGRVRGNQVPMFVFERWTMRIWARRLTNAVPPDQCDADVISRSYVRSGRSAGTRSSSGRPSAMLLSRSGGNGSERVTAGALVEISFTVTGPAASATCAKASKVDPGSTKTGRPSVGESNTDEGHKSCGANRGPGRGDELSGEN